MTEKSYTREIPRDFFNEAKLLKCMGLLSLKIVDHMCPENLNIVINETGERFIIEQDIDGNLFVANYTTTINGKHVLFATRYNSKANYTLMCIVDYEEYEVFDEKGNFTEEFKNISL